MPGSLTRAAGFGGSGEPLALCQPWFAFAEAGLLTLPGLLAQSTSPGLYSPDDGEFASVFSWRRPFPGTLGLKDQLCAFAGVERASENNGLGGGRCYLLTD